MYEKADKSCTDSEICEVTYSSKRLVQLAVSPEKSERCGIGDR